MVTAFTGLFLGIVMNRIPSDITMCLPSLMILKPAFSKARTARRCWIPGILGKSDRYLDLSDVATIERVAYRRQVFLNRDSDILESFLFGFSLRPTARQSGTAHAESLFRALQYDGVFHHHDPLHASIASVFTQTVIPRLAVPGQSS